MLSRSEENYLKSIYALADANGQNPVSTNDLAHRLNTRAASVTDMLKKLARKKLIRYKKYQGVVLTAPGKTHAMEVIRRHRLWEYFLVKKLQFPWDQVHDVAEQMEHIQSEVLIEKLDAYLGNPRFDPHGDPIPDPKGRLYPQNLFPLSSLPVHRSGKVAAVIDQQPAFLKHLDQLRIRVGTLVRVDERIEFDQSLRIRIGGKTMAHISHEIARNLLIPK